MTFYSMTAAAEHLGLSRKSLSLRAHKLGITPLVFQGSHRVFKYSEEQIEAMKKKKTGKGCK